MTCAYCVATIESGWSFCRGCGQPALPVSMLQAQTILPGQPMAAAGPFLSGPTFPSHPEGGAEPTDGPVLDIAQQVEQVLVPEAPLGWAQEDRSVPAEEPVENAPEASRPVVHSLPSYRVSPGRRRLTDRTRVSAGVAAVSVVILALASFGYLTQRHLGQTRDALAKTRATLAASQSDLTDANSMIADLNSQVLALQEDLKGARQEAKQTQSQLDETKQTLDGARDTVTIQESKITDLKTCLDGVTNALVDLADGYIQSAIGGLQAVSGPCKRARNNV